MQNTLKTFATPSAESRRPGGWAGRSRRATPLSITQEITVTGRMNPYKPLATGLDLNNIGLDSNMKRQDKRCNKTIMSVENTCTKFISGNSGYLGVGGSNQLRGT